MAAQARADRSRSHRIAATGFRMHRLSYHHIVHELPETLATIRVMLADGQGRPLSRRHLGMKNGLSGHM